MELHEVYRETRLRLIDLAPTLSDIQLATMTPSCPEWSVHDVYAHLAGLAADLAGGGIRGGAPDQTARQVTERSEWTIHEICDDWSRHAPVLEARIETEGRAMARPVIDVWTHEQDIANAAGVRSGRSGSGLMVTLNAAWTMKRKIRDAALPTLRLVTEDVDWTIGDETPAVTVRTTSYEMARAVLGRRSLDQIRGYEWTGDPEPYLPLIAVFTPPSLPVIEI